MYAIIVDGKNHAKLVSLRIDSEFTRNYIIPCVECGTPVLYEYTINGVCSGCAPNSARFKELENLGWMWEHPGYWLKNFGDRITVTAGTGEYRLDFTFCGADHDQAYGPDLCIELDDWARASIMFSDRGCFTRMELEELELVYQFLYTNKMQNKVYGDKCVEVDYGSLAEPDGAYIHGTDESIYIAKGMLFKDIDEDMTEEQSNIFCDLCAIIVEFLHKKIG